MIPDTLLEYIWWLTIEGTVKDSVFHKFCGQRKLLLLYKLQINKAAMRHIYTNATSGLRYDLIQSWMDFSVTVSTIPYPNFLKKIQMKNCTSNNVVYSTV